ARLASWLLARERRNDIRGFRFTIYEPEIHRFGGEGGMDVAHALFDAGTEIVLSYETLPVAARHELGRHELSLANTSDLLARSLEDRAEIWDVWRRLQHLLSNHVTVPTHGNRDRWRPFLDGLDAIV